MPQRVLITAGIGRAFAATGAKVFVCDIDTGSLDALAKEIPGVIARRYDMARRAEIERMVPDAVARLGGSTC
jgi:NADP-dependent 3-hydroxy acid dehydrogenase YdfG